VLTGSLTKWITNLLPGMKFVGYGGGVYTIKSIESETSMTLTTTPAAGDSWTADFTKTYSVRMLFDAAQWLDMFPIFAVTRPDGSAGALNQNGGLNPLHSTIVHREVINYNDSFLSVAGLSATKTLITLPIGGIVEQVYLGLETNFAAPGLSSLTFRYGDAASPIGLVDSANMRASTNGITGEDKKGAYLLAGGGKGDQKLFSLAGTTDLIVTITAIGANLNALTAGKLAVYTLRRTLPVTQAYL
jgi:hypothetical protein